MIRNGVDYISHSARKNVHAYFYDKKIPHVLQSPLKSQVESVASLYYDKSASTPSSFIKEGTESVSLTVATPTSRNLLFAKADTFRVLARSYYGLPGRMPDYMNSAVACWYGA